MANFSEKELIEFEQAYTYGEKNGDGLWVKCPSCSNAIGCREYDCLNIIGEGEYNDFSWNDDFSVLDKIQERIINVATEKPGYFENIDWLPLWLKCDDFEQINLIETIQENHPYIKICSLDLIESSQVADSYYYAFLSHDHRLKCLIEFQDFRIYLKNKTEELWDELLKRREKLPKKHKNDVRNIRYERDMLSVKSADTLYLMRWKSDPLEVKFNDDTHLEVVINDATLISL